MSYYLSKYSPDLLHLHLTNAVAQISVIQWNLRPKRCCEETSLRSASLWLLHVWVAINISPVIGLCVPCEAMQGKSLPVSSIHIFTCAWNCSHAAMCLVKKLNQWKAGLFVFRGRANVQKGCVLRKIRNNCADDCSHFPWKDNIH